MAVFRSVNKPAAQLPSRSVFLFDIVDFKRLTALIILVSPWVPVFMGSLPSTRLYTITLIFY